jgi:hypothetical protein
VDAALFGIFDMRGLPFIAGNVLLHGTPVEVHLVVTVDLTGRPRSSV